MLTACAFEPVVEDVLYNWVGNALTFRGDLAGTTSLNDEFRMVAGYNITWHESAFTPIDLLTLAACPVGLVRDTSTGVPLCVPCPGDKVASGGMECVPKIGTIALLTPINDAATGRTMDKDFLSISCAAKLAVRHVNEADETVVPGLGRMVRDLVRLDYHLLDSRFDPTYSSAAYLELQSVRAIDAIVGPARSASSIAVASMAKLDKVPQCSYWSSSPLLSNKLDFPYFSRTFPPDTIASRLLTRLIRSLGWKAFAVVFELNDPYSKELAVHLQEDSPPLQLQLRVSAGIDTAASSSYADAIAAVKASGVNIFIAALYAPDILPTLNSAQMHGILGAGYAWLLADTASVDEVMSYASDHGLAQSAAFSLLDGMLAFRASPVGTAGYSRYAAEFTSQQLSECENGHFNVTDYPTIFSNSNAFDMWAYAYDCVVATAIAIARSTDPTDGDEVYTNLKRAAFDGASGSVAFDPNVRASDDRTPAFEASSGA